MKKILVLTVLTVTAAAAAFANGNKEAEQPVPYGYGRAPRGGYAADCPLLEGEGVQPGRGMMYWTDEEGNPVTPDLTEAEGTLVLEEGTLPYLMNGGEKVFLMVPPFAIQEVELTGGESVKVSGYEVPGGRWGTETESLFLHVVTAEIDGQVLTLERGAGPGAGGKGGRGGRGGHHGHGRW